MKRNLVGPLNKTKRAAKKAINSINDENNPILFFHKKILKLYLKRYNRIRFYILFDILLIPLYVYISVELIQCTIFKIFYYLFIAFIGYSIGTFYGQYKKIKSKLILLIEFTDYIKDTASYKQSDVDNMLN